MGLKKSLDMFNFTKSETDLGKLAWPTQYKVICDWLRSTKIVCDRLDRQSKVIQLDIAKLYDLLLKDDSPPDDIEDERSDIDTSTDTESVR